LGDLSFDRKAFHVQEIKENVGEMERIVTRMVSKR